MLLFPRTLWGYLSAFALSFALSLSVVHAFIVGVLLTESWDPSAVPSLWVRFMSLGGAEASISTAFHLASSAFYLLVSFAGAIRLMGVE